MLFSMDLNVCASVSVHGFMYMHISYILFGE